MDENGIAVSITPIHNDDNDLTIYGYNFKVNNVLPYFYEKSNLITLDMYGKEATVYNYKKIALHSKVKYFFILGHGNKNNFLTINSLPEKYNNHGNYENLFNREYNPEVKNKIFHMSACNTAKNLGEQLVENGASAFIGYNEPLGVKYHGAYLHEILLCDSKIDKSLADGNTVAEAHKRAYEAFEKFGDEYYSNDRIEIANDFYRHRDALCSPVTDSKYGNKSAKII